MIDQVFPDYHGVAWYWCELAPVAVPTGHRALLGSESVDYAARVWLNGDEIGSHEGEGVPFELGATELGAERVNLLAVRVVNPNGEPDRRAGPIRMPHANQMLPGEFRPGWACQFGGIIGEVAVHVEPEARLLETVVRSQLATGVINVDVAVPKSLAVCPRQA